MPGKKTKDKTRKAATKPAPKPSELSEKELEKVTGGTTSPRDAQSGTAGR